MKKIATILFLLSLHLSCWANATLRLEFPKSTVSTGEIVTVQLSLDPLSAQALPVQSLKGETLGDLLYVQSVGPLLRKDGEQEFTAQAEIVFIKSPEGNEIKFLLKGQPIRIHWNNVRIESNEVPRDYILSDFTIPTPRNIIFWLLILSAVVLFAKGILMLRGFLDRKNRLRNEKKMLRDSVVRCKTYEEVVELWRNKSRPIKMFPHLDEPFKRLELVLFKVQFKPFQTSQERDQVLDAYRRFVKEVEGGFNGI